MIDQSHGGTTTLYSSVTKELHVLACRLCVW